MSLTKDIPELIKAGIISEETAAQIIAYYRRKESQSPNRLMVVFGVLGAILVSLGIILILAHNWDELPRAVKLFFAFLPLLIGQGICVYTLLKKRESISWRESSASFLFFAVGACMALITQIYNIPGDFGMFMLAWMLLCLPLMYIMQSSMVSLLYLVGIIYYTCFKGYFNYPSIEPYIYWALLLGMIPYYYYLIKNKPNSNFTYFLNWLVPLSVIIVLGTFSKGSGELMFVAYMSLFGVLYLIGDLFFSENTRPLANGYVILSSLGTLGVLLGLSFDALWENLRTDALHIEFGASSFIMAALFTLVGLGLLILKINKKGIGSIQPMDYVFAVFVPIFIIGLTTPFAVVLVNILVLLIGIMTIRKGAKEDNLGQLNFGLIIITILVICRFFDTDLSFVIRGILFLMVGGGFFAANYLMLKKRKENELE